MTQLDPNLKPFVKNGLLHHPLVVCVADTDADRNLVNSQYREKKAIASAIAKQNWPAYIALHERPYRLRALASILSELGDRRHDPIESDQRWTRPPNPVLTLMAVRRILPRC